MFATDRMSRRSLRRFIASGNAEVLVARCRGKLAGCAVVLFRRGSSAARLYSVAVGPALRGRGVGPALLEASEQAARLRGCAAMRLEVHRDNERAIARYRKAGYREFGRHKGYYADGGDALRFEKPLASAAASRRTERGLTH